MWFAIGFMGFIFLTHSIVQKIFNIYPESFLTWFVIGNILLVAGILGSIHNNKKEDKLTLDEERIFYGH